MGRRGGAKLVGVGKARLRSWKSRPVLAIALRLVILLVPVGAALGATAAVHSFYPLPPEWPGRLVWWIAMLGAGLGAAMAVERVGRRFLPLVMLLKLSMLFPDRAPSRFAVAREAGSVRKLKARLGDLGADPEAWTASQILSLAVALQSHDRQTRGHSERVRTFTDLLADQLKLSADDRYRLRWAALLHDIGKLTVASGILNKPGKLDEREWELMRRHPAEGVRIAAPLIEWLGPWAGAIGDHHERFDGAGYPANLAGHDISLAGRIVSVADCYDTMTAARSYKKPMAIKTARQELARCAGGQFDPAVVRAFLNISLPLLLWKTGPLSFLVQLPFLARMQEVAQQGISVATQGLTAATVAAGVTAMTVAGPPTTSTSAQARPPIPITSPALVPGATAPSPSSPGTGSTRGRGATGDPTPRPSPQPSPRPTPEPSPVPSPSDSPPPNPLPLPTDPLPLPLPTDPLPLPSILPSILPLPSPSLPFGLEPEREDIPPAPN